MTHIPINNIAPDKKLDEFLDGLTTLVADAVEKGIRAALSGQAAGSEQLPRGDLQNHSRGLLSGLQAKPADGLGEFKPPKAD